MAIDWSNIQYRIRQATPAQKRLAVMVPIVAVAALVFTWRLLASGGEEPIDPKVKQHADQVAQSIQKVEPPPPPVSENIPDQDRRRSTRQLRNPE